MKREKDTPQPATGQLDTQKVAQLLTLSTRQLKPDTLSALAQARHQALAKQAVPAPAFSLTSGGLLHSLGLHNLVAHSLGTHGLIPLSAKRMMATGLLVVACVIGLNLWQHTQLQQLSELDAAILTDDLPIEMFVD